MAEQGAQNRGRCRIASLHIVRDLPQTAPARSTGVREARGPPSLTRNLCLHPPVPSYHPLSLFQPNCSRPAALLHTHALHVPSHHTQTASRLHSNSSPHVLLRAPRCAQWLGSCSSRPGHPQPQRSQQQSQAMPQQGGPAIRTPHRTSFCKHSHSHFLPLGPSLGMPPGAPPLATCQLCLGTWPDAPPKASPQRGARPMQSCLPLPGILLVAVRAWTSRTALGQAPPATGLR